MKLKKVIAVGFATFALAGMAACSSDSDTDADNTTQATSDEGTETSADEGAADEGAAEEGTDGAASAGEATTGGSTEVKVEGEDLPNLDLASVTCIKDGGKITIGSGSASAAEGLAIVMTDENPPKIEAFSIVVDDVALAVADQGGASVGSAEVTVDGDEYTITGTAAGADMSDPTAGMIEKDFSVTVTCS